jgi:DNA primase
LGLIPEQTLDHIRDSVGLVEVIGEYVQLTQSGGVYRGLCPFHAEKTPSFTVNPQRGIFHCFGCGVGGNVFRFLMMHKGLSFPEAAEELAQRAGVELKLENGEGRNRARRDKSGLYRAAFEALTYFRDGLHGPDGRQARDYLADRGLSGEIWEEFSLGWAPAGWDNLYRHLKAKNAPDELLAQAGLIKPRKSGRGYYDVFRERVITPIFDLDGKPVAFGGRLLKADDHQPKYINSPETPIYKKGRLLYGLDRHQPHIKDKGLVLLVEGYFDLIALASRGLRYTAATLGTALTLDHLRLLKGRAKRVVLIFDADQAGQNAAARALPLFLAADMEGVVLTLPENHDPDTFVREHGAAALEDALGDAVDLMEFFVERTLAKHPDSLAGKSRALQDVLYTLNQVENPAKRDLLRGALAHRLGVREESLRLSERPRFRGSAEPAPDATAGDLVLDLETELLRFLLLHPEFSSRFLSGDQGFEFFGTEAASVFAAMQAEYAEAGDLDPDRLINRLNEEESALVAALAAGDDGLDAADLADAAADFQRKFFERSRRRRESDLSTRIKQAAQSGDMDGLRRLLAEKNKSLRERNA